jgi:phosphatidylglycerophosphate synthase
MVSTIRNLVRRWMQDLVAPWLDRVTRGRLHPDTLTYISLGMHVPIAWLIAVQHNWLAAGLLVVFGLFDALDGALARVQHRTSARGMMLDSATDRVKEILLYTGAAYAVIGATDRPYLAVWAVAACGASLLTSYINAWGDAVMAKYGVGQHLVNKAFRGGLFPFEVRMVVLLLGLLSNRVALALIVIALGAGYTALERLVRVLRKLSEANV